MSMCGFDVLQMLQNLMDLTSEQVTCHCFSLSFRRGCQEDLWLHDISSHWGVILGPVVSSAGTLSTHTHTLDKKWILNWIHRELHPMHAKSDTIEN